MKTLRIAFLSLLLAAPALGQQVTVELIFGSPLIPALDPQENLIVQLTDAAGNYWFAYDDVNGVEWNMVTNATGGGQGYLNGGAPYGQTVYSFAVPSGLNLAAVTVNVQDLTGNDSGGSVLNLSGGETAVFNFDASGNFGAMTVQPQTGTNVFVSGGNIMVNNSAANPVPVTLADVGDVGTAQDWFLCGLEWGSGIAALLFGFLTVRRALSIGDAWND